MARAVLALLACLGCADEQEIVPAGDHFTYVAYETTIDHVSAIGTLIRFVTYVDELQDQAVDRGRILQLIDLQTTAFKSAPAIGIRLMLGDAPSPAPCLDADDEVCRRHLDGTAELSIAADSPTHPALVGSIDNTRRMTTRTGEVAVQVALDADEIVTLHLFDATMTGYDTWERFAKVSVYGFVHESDVRAQLLPAKAAALQRLVEDHCSDDCRCTDESAAYLLHFLDRTPADCTISIDELETYLATEAGFRPVEIDGIRAYAFGVGIRAVQATIRQ